jgi:hypothetical protein
MRTPGETLIDYFGWLNYWIDSLLIRQEKAEPFRLPAIITLLARARIERLCTLIMKIATNGPLRKRKPRPSAPRPKPAYVLPRNFNWLHRLYPGTATDPDPISRPAETLRHLMAEREFLALIEANPALGRVLRPLCHALGVKPPAALILPRRPRAALILQGRPRAAKLTPSPEASPQPPHPAPPHAPTPPPPPPENPPPPIPEPRNSQAQSPRSLRTEPPSPNSTTPQSQSVPASWPPW